MSPSCRHQLEWITMGTKSESIDFIYGCSSRTRPVYTSPSMIDSHMWHESLNSEQKKKHQVTWSARNSAQISNKEWGTEEVLKSVVKEQLH